MLPINSVDKQVGALIEKRRIVIGESRDSLAHKLNVIPELLEKWELGYARVPADVIRTVAGLLNVKPAFFFSFAHQISEIDPSHSKDPDNSELKQMVRIVIALRNISSPEIREYIINIAEVMAKIPELRPVSNSASRSEMHKRIDPQ